MCALPVTDDSCISQQFKDPQQLQPEKIPPLSALLVLKAQTGFHFTATVGSTKTLSFSREMTSTKRVYCMITSKTTKTKSPQSLIKRFY